ncbi:MAG: RimK family alpha-L-glutamate ligase, partial [Halobacteria archaeon]|nr:RimK family alpha-L-glutamate ligase [Halobacteria archaeon]
LSGKEFDADVGLVYPSRLIEGGVVDALSDIEWINDSDDVLTSRNKARCTALLNRQGVDVPDTFLISNPVSDDEIAEAVEEVGLPAVVKPNSATRGEGVVRVDDIDSAVGVADYLRTIHESSLVFDRSFVVQEFVEDARDYRVTVIDGEYVGAVERRSGGWKHNVHRGAEAVGVTPPSEVVDLAERAAEAVGAGFCGVDILRNGARTLVNETNARPTVDSSEKYETKFYDVLARLVERSK